MNQSDILIKPVLTEKAYEQQEKSNVFTFVVDRRANKLEIKKAIEDFYSVDVKKVRTLVVAGKSKTRYTKAGVIKGKKSAYKKAMVELNEGDTIDLFS